MQKASMVVTTIFDPIALEGYYDNFAKYGHLEQVQIFVIPDKKTPADTFARCSALTKRGLKIVCPTIEEQEAFLRKVGFAQNLVPYNSDNRRNVGYLMALETGDDFIISIDDDNYCRADEDYFQAHAVVCEKKHSGQIVNTETGWFNICSLMELDRPGATYPRGFPYKKRHQSESPTYSQGHADVHINAGLWLLDPDVDAISWLVAPAHTISFNKKPLLLGKQAWSPVNTQNTGLRREAIAAYYFVKMGYPLSGGIPIDRYGDIFSGYFVEACARHLGGSVRVGTPIAEHRRNSHNYLNDASREWSCIMVLEDLLPWLTQAKLSGTTYPETFVSLSHGIEEIVEQFNGSIWTDATRGYFHQLSYCIREWAKTCTSLLNK